MSENNPEVSWPPKRQRHTYTLSTPIQQHPTPLTPHPHLSPFPALPQTPVPARLPVLADKKNRKTYRNNFEVKPKTPSYKPFALNNPGHIRCKAFAFGDVDRLKALDSLSVEEWNSLMILHGEIEAGHKLRDFQIECANFVIARTGDLCLIAPTGSGKSKIWVLPLLMQAKAILLVTVPFTSLGFQGEARHSGTSIQCSFLHSDSQDEQILSKITKGGDKQVVYACVEMLETPAVARVLRSNSFKSQLLAVYLDKPFMVPRLYPSARASSHSWD
ncbi:hypothetical protein DXG01_013581 [Tephrocybe rancida]|nr:hypothetical protein DXG01_013581 [Tephrocybe rancida]